MPVENRVRVDIFVPVRREDPAYPAVVDWLKYWLAYISYFENRYGEQALFVHNRNTGQTALFCGDAGWQAYPVRNGRVEGLRLNPEEQLWLEACWRAVTGRSSE